MTREEFEALRRVRARRPARAHGAAHQGVLVPAVRRRHDRDRRAYADGRGPALARGGGRGANRGRRVAALAAYPEHRDRMRLLRAAENPAGALLHVLRGGAGAALPVLRRARAATRRASACPAAPRSTAPRARRAAAAPEAALPPEERRQVTVLFADLSGYTAVAERMDPEAVKSLVDRALRRLGEEVQRFGGTVDKYIGDNVMALFGAPGGPRGRRRAGGARRAGDAGGDGRDQRLGALDGPRSPCAWGSTPARCWRAQWAATTR